MEPHDQRSRIHGVLGTGRNEGARDSWVEFDVGGAAFGIGNGEPMGIVPGSCFAITFASDDVDAERERLLALGVPVTEIHDEPGCRSAFVTDPEGNTFGIHQLKN